MENSLKKREVSIAIKMAEITSGGRGFFSLLLDYKIIYIILFFVLINSVIIGIQTKSISAVLSDLGQRFLNPLSSVKDTSDKIVANGFLYDSSKGFFLGTFELILNLVGTFSQFIILFAWISVISSVIRNVILSDSSKVFGSYIIGLIVYLLLLTIYLAFTKQDILLPIKAIRSLINAIPYIVKPIAKVGEKILNLHT